MGDGDKHDDANDGGDTDHDDGDDLHEDKHYDANDGGDDEDEDGKEDGNHSCDDDDNDDGGDNNDHTQDDDLHMSFHGNRIKIWPPKDQFYSLILIFVPRGF